MASAVAAASVAAGLEDRDSGGPAASAVATIVAGFVADMAAIIAAIILGADFSSAPASAFIPTHTLITDTTAGVLDITDTRTATTTTTDTHRATTTTVMRPRRAITITAIRQHLPW